MPRKPNYRFDRMERDRQKAAKKAERLEAKRVQSAEKKGLNPDGTPATETDDAASELPGETPTGLPEAPAPEEEE